MILCDTNIFIYALQGNKKYLSFLMEEEVCMSALSYVEILVGIEKNNVSQKKVEEFLSLFPIISFDALSANFLVTLIVKEKIILRKSNPIDLLIGATAASKKMDIVTNNIKDFKYFTSIKIKKI